MKNKILFLDRDYLFKYIKTDEFEPIYVALNAFQKEELISLGQNVIACFEEDYDSLPVSEFGNDYLIYSMCGDRFLNIYNAKKREEILGKSITFWKNILDMYKPVCIVNEVCTMEWLEVLYIESQKRKIPYHTFLYGLRPGYSSWLDTPFSSRICKDRWDAAIPSSEDIEQAKTYYNGIKVKHSKPFYIQNVKTNLIRNLFSSAKYYYKSLYQTMFRKGFVYEHYEQIAKVLFDCNIGRCFNKYDKLEDIDTSKYSYIYYPIHYEPEATLTYFGYPYVDQANNILEIAMSLGTKQFLIVKEHPQQAGMMTTARFQRVKKQCQNLIYLKSTISSYEVINKISLMVTLNGTAGLEAMILGKPVIVLGSVFYDSCKSVNLCNDFRELRKIIRGGQYNMPDEQDLIDLLAKFFSMQTKGYPAARKVAGYDENFENLIKQIAIYASA